MSREFAKKTKWIFLFSIILLILRLSLSSFAMEQVKTKIDDHTIRLDYVDKDNNVVCYPSLGYATIIRTLDENGRALTDFYLDENGNPVSAPGGQYGVIRVYNDQGQEYEFVYLNNLNFLRDFSLNEYCK